MSRGNILCPQPTGNPCSEITGVLEDLWWLQSFTGEEAVMMVRIALKQGLQLGKHPAHFTRFTGGGPGGMLLGLTLGLLIFLTLPCLLASAFLTPIAQGLSALLQSPP